MSRILLTPFERALVVEGPHATLDEHLKAFGITARRLDKVPDEDALIAALQQDEAHVLFKRSRVPVTRRVLEACPSLYAVQLCCIGDDSVDKAAAADHGVMVFNDPASNARSVVELAMGHMIALSRRLYETNTESHDNAWHKNNRARFEVYGKVLGIVGLGNIGRQVARAASSLGMTIRFWDNRPVAQEVGQEMGWESASSLESLFRGADIVTVHTSARDAWGNENENFLDEVLGQLGADRPEPCPRIFLNLARGNLHTSDALIEAVGSNAIRRAAVDVYPSEPAPGQGWTNPYQSEPRIVCTPHIGAATQEAQPRIARRVARTLGRFSQMGHMRDCVFGPRSTLSVADVRPGNAVLAVAHSTSRGTKKAVSDAIYEAEASTLGSAHRDFAAGIAYDLSVIDHPLSQQEIEHLVARADELAGEAGAIRSVRQMVVPTDGWSGR